MRYLCGREILRTWNMTKILNLFTDTNSFVQCVPLDQVNWSAWKEFDEVHLIVSRPIQSEIDKQKNKGSDRLGKRARSTSSLFREIILGPKVIVESGPPCVKLVMRHDLKPSRELSDRLNYEEPDDQLVGIAYGFAQQNPDADVRILTNDTGPMASAHMVGVGYVEIPDDWLLPPENTEAEKRMNALKAEVERLRRTEPKFPIICSNAEGREISQIECDTTNYIQLNQDQVSALMSRISQERPPANDFGSCEPAERPANRLIPGLAGMRETFTPPTEKEISIYRDEEYPKWLQDCENALRDLHHTLENRDGVPVFRFAAMNQGTRPGEDVLVIVKAKGGIAIKPPENDEEADTTLMPLRLPCPARDVEASAACTRF
jgi:hypothetical protein